MKKQVNSKKDNIEENTEVKNKENKIVEELVSEEKDEVLGDFTEVEEIKETAVAITDREISNKLILVGEKKEKPKTNKFDRFWLKVWSGIVAFVATLGGWLNAFILLIFRKSAPQKYCNAFIAFVLLVIVLAIFISPFRITVTTNENIDIYNDGLVPVLIEKGTSVNSNEKVYLWGYANKKGKLVVEADYDEVTTFNHGVAFVKLTRTTEDYSSTEWMLINKKGKQKGNINIPNVPDFKPVGDFSNDPDVAWVYIAGVYRYMGKNGKFAFKDQTFDEASDFIDGVAKVKKGNNIYFINKKGKALNEDVYDDARDMSEGYAAVKSGGRWGFINAKGKLVVSREWDEVSDFHGGYAAVKRGTTKGVINTKGELIVDTGNNFSEILFEYDFWENSTIN